MFCYTVVTVGQLSPKTVMSYPQRFFVEVLTQQITWKRLVKEKRKAEGGISSRGGGCTPPHCLTVYCAVFWIGVSKCWWSAVCLVNCQSVSSKRWTSFVYPCTRNPQTFTWSCCVVCQLRAVRIQPLWSREVSCFLRVTLQGASCGIWGLTVSKLSPH